jgi:lipopolysaccharide/colanic/teichoic acid biosynthesis glycosyltransferase
MSLQYAYAPRRANASVVFDATKRTFDVVVASLFLLVLSPIFLVLAFLIKRSSPGPVLFRQVRVGKDGQYFRIFKFRTMGVDADRSGPQITSADDSRVTPLGRRLRTLKLDELPQLLNVLRGEMSLVGPRPQVPKFVDEFDPAYREIVLAVKPGITGPTQLRFRNEEALLKGRPDRERYYIEEVLPVKCALDVDYVKRRSLRLDFGVLMTTGTLLVAATARRLVRKSAEVIEDVTVVEEFREATVRARQVTEESVRPTPILR